MTIERRLENGAERRESAHRDTTDTTPSSERGEGLSHIARLLGMTEIDQLCATLSDTPDSGSAVAELLRHMAVTVETEEMQLERIPARGKLVLVCDQSYGSVEALAVHQLLTARRADVRVFINQLLSEPIPLGEAALFIDPGFRVASRVRNVLSLKTALRHLAEGGALGVLPVRDTESFDGEVWQVVDATWHQSVVDVLRETDATVLPIHFHASGPTSDLVGRLFEPALRLGAGPTPPRPVTLRVELGAPVRGSELAELPSTGAALDLLRARCRSLALRLERGARGEARHGDKHPAAPLGTPAQVADAEDPQVLQQEIAALPETQRLLSQRGRLVAYFRGAQCPQLLLEIGRLRQLTFRAVGEGTDAPRDLDEYDAFYDHLFVWNEETLEVIGAYRLGRLDALGETSAPYSSTLFNYQADFFTTLGPAIELGRSFVRPEYQRSPAGLIMLWKGIAQYLIDNPRYRHLLGPVSISAEYSEPSQQLLVRYLEEAHYDAGLASKVTPRTPFDPAGERHTLWARLSRHCADLPQLHRLISHLERDGKGVPVLVKSYVQLGGRMLGFNVDPDFGHCVDGLVWVDLLRTPEASLRQFMGAEAAQSFLRHHQC